MAATFRERQWLEFCKEQGLPYTEDDLERAKQIEDENKKQLQERQRKRAEGCPRNTNTRSTSKINQTGCRFYNEKSPDKGQYVLFKM